MVGEGSSMESKKKTCCASELPFVDVCCAAKMLGISSRKLHKLIRTGDVRQDSVHEFGPTKVAILVEEVSRLASLPVRTSGRQGAFRMLRDLPPTPAQVTRSAA